MFSCKFAACFQNTFSQEHLWMAASVRKVIMKGSQLQNRCFMESVVVKKLVDKKTEENFAANRIKKKGIKIATV